jgi:hypothetical protein
MIFNERDVNILAFIFAQKNENVAVLPRSKGVQRCAPFSLVLKCNRRGAFSQQKLRNFLLFFKVDSKIKENWGKHPRVG